MILVGIILALVVIYALLPGDKSQEYDEYCRMENKACRYHSNRNCYLQYR